MKTWCIPPKANAEFVYHMEDVLRVYHMPYDRHYPVICMDEASKQSAIPAQSLAASVRDTTGTIWRRFARPFVSYAGRIMYPMDMEARCEAP